MADDGWMDGDLRRPVDLRTDRAHAARVYDVLLGGKTNYPADRAMAAEVIAKMPTAQTAARVNRAFVLRTTRYLAAEAGVRQFLDIGTGIPTAPHLHEVAQAEAADTRVVYVDNDPIVLAHSRALHVSHPSGRTAYVQADVTEPGSVLGSPALRDTLDLTQPIAMTMCLLLHWLPQEADPHAIVRSLVEALPSGSYLVISVMARELAAGSDGLEGDFAEEGTALHAHTKEEALRFFDGTKLVDPGLVVPQHWRPDLEDAAPGGAPGALAAVPGDDEAPIWAGVALKTS
ncbi:methyltransferase [Streptomyces sp. AcH 505]|nr:methyltransferase [Streptomyces sp. AcH 505]